MWPAAICSYEQWRFQEWKSQQVRSGDKVLVCRWDPDGGQSRSFHCGQLPHRMTHQSAKTSLHLQTPLCWRDIRPCLMLPRQRPLVFTDKPWKQEFLSYSCQMRLKVASDISFESKCRLKTDMFRGWNNNSEITTLGVCGAHDLSPLRSYQDWRPEKVKLLWGGLDGLKHDGWKCPSCLCNLTRSICWPRFTLNLSQRLSGCFRALSGFLTSTPTKAQTLKDH